MHTHSGSIPRILLALLLLALLPLASAARGQGSRAPEVRVGEQTVTWSPRPDAAAELTVAGPEGYYLRKGFAAGEPPTFNSFDRTGKSLPDGLYAWELRFTPQLSRRQRADLEASRAANPGGGNKRPKVPAEAFAGAFTLAGDRQGRRRRG